MSSTLIKAVEDTYGSIARRELDKSTNASSGDSTSASRIAAAFGYSTVALESIPDGANMGLSCGNPVGVASIQQGECVVDLGSGGALDVLLAAPKVGESGRVIGLDMSEDMLELARRNTIRAGYSPPHVEFMKTVLPDLPLESNTADLVISNCVLNLLPSADKPRVWVEIARILKPGGRVAISDILAKRELPKSIKADLDQWVGCIAGASTIEEYKKWMTQAGFSDTNIIATGVDLSIYSQIPELNANQTSSSSVSCCRGPDPNKACSKLEETELACQETTKSTCCGTAPQASTTKELREDGLNTTLSFNVNDYVGSFLILGIKT